MTENPDWVALAAIQRSAIDVLKARVEELEDALRVYGAHKHGCAWRLGRRACNCGLDRVCGTKI